MLTVEMTSTTVNPSITLPRNRSVGSFIHANFKPTPDLPATLPAKDGSGSAKLPSPMPRINAELIKGRKFEHIGDPAIGQRAVGLQPRSHVRVSRQWHEIARFALSTLVAARPARAHPANRGLGPERGYPGEIPCCKVRPRCF